MTGLLPAPQPRRGVDAAALSARHTTPHEVAAKWLATYRAENTRAAYRRDVVHVDPARARVPAFLQWCALVDVDPWSVDRFTITLWLRSLDEHDLSARTTARRVAAVRGFYAYAAEVEGIIAVSPVPSSNRHLHLDPVSTDESPTRGLTRGEAAKVLRAARRRSPRDGAIIAALYHQGLRASELCALDTGDVRLDSGHRTLRVRGKGRKVRTIKLAAPAAREIEHWLADRTAQGLLDMGLALPGVAAGDTPLFVDEHGQRMTRHQVTNVIVRSARRAGIAGGTVRDVRPHAFRHTATTHLLADGAPLRDVQVFVGHASADTTTGYDRRRDHLDRSPADRLPRLDEEDTTD